MTIPFPMYPQQGWVCPKCGSVYAPTTPMCLRSHGLFESGGYGVGTSPTLTPLPKDDSGVWTPPPMTTTTEARND